METKTYSQSDTENSKINANYLRGTIKRREQIKADVIAVYFRVYFAIPSSCVFNLHSNI